MKIQYEYETGTLRVLQQYSVPDEHTGGVYYPFVTAGECYLSEDFNDPPILVPSAPSQWHTWNWTTKEWEIEIDDARSLKWDEIKSERDEREFGTFEWDTNEFNGDAVSQQRIADAALDALMASITSTAWSHEWTLADNSVITLDGEDMMAVFAAMRAHIQGLHDTARDLREDIDAATTVEDVEAIAWPS